MKDIVIKSTFPYLKGSKYIGKGKTAYCFLMKDNRVLKLFYNSPETKNMFEYFRNPVEHFYELEKAGNDTFVAPKELLIKDGKLSKGDLVGFIGGSFNDEVGATYMEFKYV